MERMPFGATGHQSSRAVFGAAALGKVSKSAADRTLDALLEHGVNIGLAAHWVLGPPEAFLLTTGDVDLLPKLLDAVDRFERRPSDEDMAALVARRDLAPLFV